MPEFLMARSARFVRVSNPEFVKLILGDAAERLRLGMR
jgi:hypothetical protein